MNIIIVGAGEIGTHIALSLAAESHAIVVIEADPVVADLLNSRIDARVIVADGTSITTLIDAGVGDCDLFLTLTSDNNINLVSASIAKPRAPRRTTGCSRCPARPRRNRACNAAPRAAPRSNSRSGTCPWRPWARFLR